ncbi:MAG: efflux transporter outer membrane subunit [Pseudomonadota bacterium]
MRRTTIITLSALALAGCAAGPDYEAPTFGDDAEWRQSVDAEAGGDAGWWVDYDDPALAALVAQALEQNRELEAALARVEAAVAGRRAAFGARLPAVIADARYTNFEQSLVTPRVAEQLIRSGIIPRDGEFYNATLEASWELDLAGGIRRSVERADAQAQAAVAAAEAVALQVAAETATAYTDWQTFSHRVIAAERNVALQAESLSIIEGKVRLGLSRRLDAVRAGSALAELQSRVPPLVAAREAALERLAVLVGSESSALDLTLRAPDPAGPGTIAAGLKSDVLRRRPDVRAAERTLAAAVADQGVAAAAFFPSLTLSAAGGFEAGATSDLLSGDARSINMVPFLRWPVFQGGRLRAAKANADARQREALANYEQAVLRAFADSESAIAGYSAANQAVLAVREAQKLAAEAESLAARLYREGLVDYLALLDAQRQLATVDDALAAAEGEVLLAATRLYKALGGDWESAGS